MTVITVVSWAGGASAISLVLAIATFAIVSIVLLDYPVATSFDRRGVVRRCALRRHAIPWSRIDGLSRTADSAVVELGSSTTGSAAGSDGRSGATARRSVRGRPAGLVAVVGRRRYLLVNQSESRTECDRLRGLMEVWDTLEVWRAGHPDEDQPPTWLYRRRRWRS